MEKCSIWRECVEFYMGVHEDDADLVEKMILFGRIDVDTPFFPLYRTPLMLAVQEDSWNVFLRLLQAQCSVEITDNHGKSAVSIACEMSNRFKYAEKLVEKSSNLNIRDNTCGWSPLHWAVSRGDLPLMNLLLRNGSDPNFPDPSFNSPLHFAVKSRAEDLVLLLLRFGADSNFRDKEGYSPFYYCAICFQNLNRRHFLLLQMLLHGANLNMEYWATAQDPNLCFGVDQVTLEWFDAVRSQFTPPSLQLLSRNTLKQSLGQKQLESDVFAKALPKHVHEFLCA